MEIVKGKIANALTSASKDHVVAVAKDIYNEETEMYLDKQLQTYSTTTQMNTAITNAVNDLDVSTISGNGKYIASVTETNGKISATLGSVPTTLPASDVSAWAKASTKPTYTFGELNSKPTTLGGYGITDAKISNGVITLGENTITPVTSLSSYSTTSQMNTAITNAVNNLDVTSVGGTGKYISAISETDGKINATVATMPTNLSQFSNDTKYATSGYVDTRISNLINGAPETLDTLKEIADAVSGNSEVIDTLNSAIGTKANKATTLSGYGITDAKISNGVITLGANTITPVTSLSSYSTTSQMNTAITNAVNDLDVSTISGSGKYIASVTETNGKISATLGTVPTTLPASDVSAWAKASTKPTYTFSELNSKPTTLGGYGITDAKISNGVITLGANTITPVTSLSSYSTTSQMNTAITNASNSLDTKINALAAGAKANISVSPTYIYIGVNTAITINGSFTSNGDIVASTIKINDGTSDIASSTGNTVQAAQSITLNSATGVTSTNYRVIVTYSGAEFYSTATVSARYPILYGFGASASFVTNKLSARASAATTYTATATADDQHMYICVPIGINALTSFTMNGAPAVFDASSLTINGVSYKVYTSGGIYNTNTTLNIEAK